MTYAHPSVDYILSKYTYLKQLYSQRNAEYDILRRVFDGDFASIQAVKNSADRLFNDRIKVVYNIANATVRRYMDTMSAPPRVEALPRGFDEADIIEADNKTKFLEYVYRANNMPLKIMQGSFYQSLLDRAIFHVRPDPEKPCPISIELAIPDNFMPLPYGDNWNEYPCIIYAFRKIDENDVALDPMESRPNSLPVHQVIEYWSPNEYIKIEDGKEKLYIPHGFGQNLFFEAMNIPVPHRFRGQGDIDQIVGLNDYLNMLFSDLADIINYAANPIAVVRGSKAGATNLPFAPKAVWELERDGQAGFLQWQGAPPSVEAQILRTIQAIEDETGVSSPAFGREIPSGTSGSAVRSLLAGFNTRLGTKQQLLGEALSRANAAVLMIAERLFANREFPILGEDPRGGKRQALVKPKDFGKWYENQVIFDPLDPQTRFFQEIEKYDKRLQSRYTTMKNLGTRNVSDELERMRREQKESEEHENNMQLAKQGLLPSDEPAFDPSALIGEINKSPDIKRLLGGPERDREPAPMGQGLPESPISQLPELQGRVGVDQVLDVLKGVQGLSGGAALVGGLAKDGFTEGPIEIAIQNPADESLLRRALGPLGNRAKFSRVQQFSGEHMPLAAGAKKK